MLGFLCIGVQKAGTTTLHALLRDHTDLAVSPEKELHFFDQENRDWRSGDYTDYHVHFSGRDGVWGEITPIYIYMPGCLDRIHAYNPDIKLIAMFRDPIDRAFSHWRMEVDRGYEAMPFSDAIRDQGRGRLGRANWHRIFSYVERGFYGQNWRPRCRSSRARMFYAWIMIWRSRIRRGWCMTWPLSSAVW